MSMSRTFTYHIVNIKPLPTVPNYIDNFTFTYHIVNIKPGQVVKVFYSSDLFTYHIVNIKRDEILFESTSLQS